MKKIIFFILGFYTISLFSQSYYDNLKKYWYYRQRFKKYFIKIGTNPGESLPMSLRGYNDSHSSHQQFDWGQTTIFLGEYIGVLATEYYLLKNHGYYEHAEQTREELNNALHAAIRKDYATAHWPPIVENCGPYTGFNGFFLRDDVPADFDTSGLNNGLTYTDFDEIIANHLEGTPNICNEVHSGYTENVNDVNSLDNLESQDEAIGLYLGLALVVRCLPHYSEENVMARLLAERIFEKWRNGMFILYLPCSINNHITPPGGNSVFYEFGWLNAVNWITGDGYLVPDLFQAYQRWLSLASLYPPIYSNSDNNRMEATLGGIGDCWIIPNGLLYVNMTRIVTRLKTQHDNWDPYYLFLWKFLHNKSAEMPNMVEKAEEQLNSAPACGPYYYVVNGQKYFVEGWASSGKYYCNREKQNGTHHDQNAWQGAFNGTDYMLMFNLYTLVTEHYYDYTDLINLEANNTYAPIYVNFPPFVNNYYFDFSNPGYVERFNSIETNMVVDTVAHYYNDLSNTISGHKGHVTLRAGKKIHLKPGFHAKKGSYFHAYIQPFTCSNNTIHSPGNNYDTLFADNQNVEKIEYNDIDPVNDTYPYELMEKLDSLRNNNPSMFTDNGFIITPNPNNGQFKISAPADIQRANIFIYNSNGILVYHSTVESFPAHIDLSNESNGLYMVKIQTENNVSVVKFLKE